MSKKLLILFILILGSSILCARQVDVHSAQAIAQRFLTGQTPLLKSTQSTLELVYTAKDQQRPKNSSEQQLAYYYVFNIGNNNGFVIVSADDINVPIIGYSKEGSYDPENLPDNFKGWMQSVEQGMANAISKGTTSPRAIQSKWNSYLTKSVGPIDPIDPVEPGEGSGDYLIKTKWNQRHPYDQLIPYRINDPLNPGQTMQPATGCVATAMAQIMKYYNYPAQGIGKTDDYYMGQGGTSIPVYTEGIDISSYIYDWANMLNEYDEKIGNNNQTSIQKDAVALLMYHIGAGSHMNYDYSSSANSANAAKTMVKNFGYDKDMFKIDRYYYSDENWAKLIKKEIDNRRPVFYEGNGYAGHTFICDGYDENGLFHFNWGWGGYLDGYFTFDATLEYINNQGIIANIKPENGIDEDAERVVLSLSTNKNTYMRNEGISVSKSVSSTIGGKDGDYYVALYSMTDEFVSLITHISGDGNKYDKIPTDITPNTYKIKVLEKVLSGEYNLIKQAPTIGDVIVTVANEIKNHSLTLSSIYKTGSSLIGGDVVVTFGVYCNMLVDVYFDMVLIDQNNNQIQINNPISKTLNPSGMPIDLSYSFKIPTGVPTGTYKLTPVARETTTNWESIPSFYSDRPNYVELDIFANESDYKISSIGFINQVSSVRKNEYFGVYPNFVSNISDDSRVLNLKVALCDNNDNLITVLASEAVYTYSNSTRVDVYARANSSIPSGNYKVRLVEQTGTDTYIQAPVTGSFMSGSLTILDEVIQHELMLTNDLKAENTTVTAGGYLPVVVSFKNYSDYKYIGRCGMAITDAAGNIKSVIYTSPYSLNMPGRSSYSNQAAFFSNMRIPSDIAPGNYRLQMVAKETNRADAEWAVVPTYVDYYGNSYRDYLDIIVTSTRSLQTLSAENNEVKITVYPNPVQDILRISSPEAAIKKVTLVNKSGGVVLTDRVVETEKSIFVNHLPSDIYILRIETNEGVSNHKIIKQ